MKKTLFIILLAITTILSSCEKDSDPVAPTVETNSVVTDISSTEAIVGGKVISDGNATVLTRGICWSTKTSPTLLDNKTDDGSGIGEFSSKLMNLEPNTTYYVRAYATNSIGSAYGNETTFTTLNELTITTTEALERTSTSASTGGNIISDGGVTITARGVCWSREPEPTVLGNKTKDGEGIGEFTSELTELRTGTTYYIRAYAINKLDEIFYANEITFTTLTSDVAITTSEVSEISFTSAKSGGNITNDGDVPIVARGICWNTATKPTVSDSKTEDGEGTGEFISELTNLTVNTKYYIRAYATNELGDTFYGSEITFTTQDKIAVETSEVTDITSTSAKSGGSIATNSGVVIIERGICWGTEPNPTISDRKTEGGEGIGDFTCKLPGLKTGTQYYIRAYAKDRLGDIYYGNEITFVSTYELMDLTAGSLKNAIKALGLEDTSSLTLGGSINLHDFSYMREMINNGNLTAIDLSNVTIAATINYSDAPENTILENAFYNCKNLSSFIFPSSIISIRRDAFRGCSGLTGALKIPFSVTSIGASAFSGCKGFTALTIPNSITSIESSAFYGCTGFTGSLMIPNSVTTIGNYAFKECTGFTGSLTIGNSVITIGDFAFNECTGFTGSLTIGNSVTTIGHSAFYGCAGFTGSLTIPNSVTTIGENAFIGCTGFTGTLTIGDNVTTIKTNAFLECTGFTGSLIIPENVTSIGSQAFSGCTGFTGALTIGNSVTTIGVSAFSGCTGFTGSLTIGNSVTTIGQGAFFINAQGITANGFTGSLTIPNSVTTIGDHAFWGHYNFTHIVVSWATPIKIAPTALATGTVYVPLESLPLYQVSDVWGDRTLIGY